MGEPAENPAPLKKRRRRWLIVALLLVLLVVSGAAWWNWPRGDARFVGKWLVHHSRMKDWTATLNLYSNGTGVLTHRGTTPISIWFNWSAKQQHLVFGKEGFTQQGKLGSLVRRLFRTVTGASWSDGPYVLDIQSAGDSEIRFKNKGFFKIAGDSLRRVVQ